MREIRLPRGPWREAVTCIVRSRPDKTALVVRYGAFGDCVMAASIFPELKKLGYYVCVNTTEHGADILSTDPNIDELIVQDTDQVPNNELSEYWKVLAAGFGRFINLSESVEGRLLALRGRPEYGWSHDERHSKLNRNYIEEQHAIAGVPFVHQPRFFPTKNEEKAARQYRASIGLGNFIILWTLSGSSVHKSWPYMDEVIARLMVATKGIKVVTVGDGLCQILEAGWEKERRVIRKSGIWGIRKTLAFAERADLVIGPETGVLNAVSTFTMPKLVMLSHSSPENLTKHWVNTTAFQPRYAPCWPCHKMHYGFKTCHRDESTGAAVCAASIYPDDVTDEILRCYGVWSKLRNDRGTAA